MTAEKKRAPWVTPTVVGVCIVLVAVLILVLVELLPSVNANTGLKTRYEELKETAGFKSVTIFDPDLGNDLINQNGTEVSLNIGRGKELRDLALPVMFNAVYSESSADDLLNDFDYRLRFKNEGKSTTLYIKGDRIYYTDNGKRHYFTVDDAEAFAEMKDYIKGILEPADK